MQRQCGLWWLLKPNCKSRSETNPFSPQKCISQTRKSRTASTSFKKLFSGQKLWVKIWWKEPKPQRQTTILRRRDSKWRKLKKMKRTIFCSTKWLEAWYREFRTVQWVATRIQEKERAARSVSSSPASLDASSARRVTSNSQTGWAAT